jgi:hypothetical protein
MMVSCEMHAGDDGWGSKLSEFKGDVGYTAWAPDLNPTVPAGERYGCV